MLNSEEVLIAILKIMPNYQHKETNILIAQVSIKLNIY